jgi:hypothetical protein
MKTNVIVVGDPTTGALITPSKSNPDYGYIKVQQSDSYIDANGFFRPRIAVALIHGYVTDLQEAGYYNGQELTGRIVTRESLTPFNKANADKELKYAGKTGVVCKVNGSPIYRKTVYTDVKSIEEVLIAHDNSEEIKNALLSEKQSTIKPNEDFSIG